MNVKRSGANVNGATVTLTLGSDEHHGHRDHDSSGNATFTNVPVGTGYTIKALQLLGLEPEERDADGPDGQRDADDTINLSFSTSTCPLP